MDKKPICRADQTFLQIRTFCFKIKLFLMVAMLLLRRSCKFQIILVLIDRFVEFLLVAMLLLGSCWCMNHCLLKKQWILLFNFLSVSLIFFKFQKKKNEKKKIKIKKIKDKKKIQSQLKSNSNKFHVNQSQSQLKSVSDKFHINQCQSQLKSRSNKFQIELISELIKFQVR